jgi:uncharacterized repeat protein (TIGR02543 family)
MIYVMKKVFFTLMALFMGAWVMVHGQRDSLAVQFRLIHGGIVANSSDWKNWEDSVAMKNSNRSADLPGGILYPDSLDVYLNSFRTNGRDYRTGFQMDSIYGWYIDSVNFDIQGDKSWKFFKEGDEREKDTVKVKDPNNSGLVDTTLYARWNAIVVFKDTMGYSGVPKWAKNETSATLNVDSLFIPERSVLSTSSWYNANTNFIKGGPDNPNKNDYVFKGWLNRYTTLTNLPIDSVWNMAVDSIKTDTVFYAKWGANVKYDLAGVTVDDDIRKMLKDTTVYIGTTLQDTLVRARFDPQKVLKKANRLFKEWRKEGTTSKFTFGTDLFTKNTTLTIAWDTTCTVTFDLNGGKIDTSTVSGAPPQYVTGSIDSIVLIQSGTGTVGLPAKTPLRRADTFDGWYKEKEFENKWNSNTDRVTKDITLFAKWKEAYEIKFLDGKDTIRIDTLTKANNVIQAPPADLKKSGSAFAGWYIGNDKWSFPYGEVSGHMDFVAKWESSNAVLFHWGLNFSGKIDTINVVKSGTIDYFPVGQLSNGATVAVSSWHKDSLNGPAWGATEQVTKDTVKLFAHWRLHLRWHSIWVMTKILFQIR